MKRIAVIALVLLAITFTSCDDQISLQEYYVESTERPDFLAVDLPASMLNLSEGTLSTEQKAAYESLDKLNILAFRLTSENQDKYEIEKAKVQEILKNEDYNELMRINSDGVRGVVKYIGDDDSIDEVIIYGNDKKFGFGLVRVLGDDMRPEYMATLIDAVQKAQLDGDEFSQIRDFFRTK